MAHTTNKSEIPISPFYQATDNQQPQITSCPSMIIKRLSVFCYYSGL
jgi:hypothetical protein